MKMYRIFVLALMAAMFSLSLNAQNLSEDVQTVLPGQSNIKLAWDATVTPVAIRANNDYTVQSNQAWLKVTKAEDGKRLFVQADTNKVETDRTGIITFRSKDGSMTRTISAIQEGEKSYQTIVPTQVKPTSSKASSSNTGEGVERLFDNDPSTVWQTAASTTVSTSNPVTLTLEFSGIDEIDYMVYVPRATGSSGIWTSYSIAVTDAKGNVSTTTYTTAADHVSDTIRWSESIIPSKIVISIMGGYGGAASGAELSFFRSASNQSDLSIFKDAVYSELRDGVTQADIDALQNPFCKIMAQKIYDGEYDTKYRVASYPCRLDPQVLSDEWNAPGKQYSQIDNPTGINWRPGDTKAVIVSGLPGDIVLKMDVIAWYIGIEADGFKGANPHTTTYTLRNGINEINYKYDWAGLGYLKYYASTRARMEEGVPDIKVHFVNGEQNGILTPDKTNEEMYEMCDKAAVSGNICIDLYGSKVQSVWTSQGMRDYCKASDGTSVGIRQYMNFLDTIVGWEHEVLGFDKYNRVPVNHTFAYVNYTYYMFQGSLGVSFHHNQEKRVLNCQNMMYKDYDAVWGFSHEWGHQHQMHPYLCWGGCSEVTNNIFSYYNDSRLGYTAANGLKMSTKYCGYFWKKNLNSISGYSTGKAVSSTRAAAYKAAVKSSSLYNWCTELRELCLAEADSFITNIDDNPSRSLYIMDTDLGTELAPFLILLNYNTMVKNYSDFYPDLFEAMRQQENLPGGSMIEKQDGFDKYELIAAAQNSNKNSLYSTLALEYPTSCWVTQNYLNKGNVTWQNNSIPALFCFVRKASRLMGVNLYDFFERGGFFRLGAYQLNDYGVKYSLMTQKMLDEFKEDMKQLEDNNVIEPMTESLLEELFNMRDFNKTATDRYFSGPEIPN